MLLPPVESNQFTLWAFTRRAHDCGLVPSMGSIRDCYDNAVIESFRGKIQTELLNRKRWKTRIELANAMFEYLEIFHNRHDRHRALGMLTPIEYENVHFTLHTSTRSLKSDMTTPRNSGNIKVSGLAGAIQSGLGSQAWDVDCSSLALRLRRCRWGAVTPTKLSSLSARLRVAGRPVRGTAKYDRFTEVSNTMADNHINSIYVIQVEI